MGFLSIDATQRAPFGESLTRLLLDPRRRLLADVIASEGFSKDESRSIVNKAIALSGGLPQKNLTTRWVVSKRLGGGRLIALADALAESRTQNTSGTYELAPASERSTP